MKSTDASEKGLESGIIASLVSEAGYIQGDSKLAQWTNKALYRTAITLRFIATGELGRYSLSNVNH